VNNKSHLANVSEQTDAEREPANIVFIGEKSSGISTLLGATIVLLDQMVEGSRQNNWELFLTKQKGENREAGRACLNLKKKRVTLFEPSFEEMNQNLG
jgi:hypothetical protein